MRCIYSTRQKKARAGCRINRERTMNPNPKSQSAGLESTTIAGYRNGVTAAEVIEEIKHLPREEQSRVIRFAFELARERQASGKDRLLSPDELGELARRMVEAEDPAEADRLQEEIVRGFYGGQSHA
jgi:hypothetical protein